MAKKKDTNGNVTDKKEPVVEEKAASEPASPAESADVKKKGQRPGKAPRRGKKLRGQLKNRRKVIAKTGAIQLPEAVKSLKKMKRAKFDETVEIHMSLGVDVTQSDQIVRGTVALPHGTGKDVRVLVFCQGENVEKAQAAGAEFVGGDEFVNKIQKEGWLDFDRVLATPDMMGKVGRLGKVLGPRGLMPSPKAGTVVTGDIGEAVGEFKAGKVEYRTDKSGNVHAGVGKLSFEDGKLVENIATFVDQIKAVKPAGVRGQYIESVHVSATMSPGIPVSV